MATATERMAKFERELAQVGLKSHGIIPDSSPEAKRIFSDIVPSWQALFLSKNSEYQTGSEETDTEADTGLIGQYSDMYRKLKKLRRPLLFGDFDALQSEDAEQILMDLVGHCFLTIDMLRQGTGRVWGE